MHDLTVAAIQMNAPVGEIERNLRAHVRLAKAAAGQGAELVCFPELSVTGHWCSGKVWSAAEPVPDGDSVQRMNSLASALGIFISFGIAEKDCGIVYNTQVVVGPEGYLGKQRKLHPSGDEYFHFRGGAEISVLDIGKCRLGIGICYDNLFPEVPRVAALRGAEVYLMPHAARCGKWPSGAASQAESIAQHKHVWTKVFASRAYDNGMFVVLCNQAGRADRETQNSHVGGILVFDPSGEVLAQSQATRIVEEIVITRLEAQQYEARRQSQCFMIQTRRPELYGEIVRSR